MSLRRVQRAFPDGEVHGIEFGDAKRPLAALFLHANGLNAMTYQSLLEPLGKRARVAGIDLRGHGLTSLTTQVPLKSWNVYRDDVIDWLEAETSQTETPGLILAGHSLGAVISLLVAGKRPDLVKGLVLADPPIAPAALYATAHISVNLAASFGPISTAVRKAKRRREQFDSRAAARESYARRQLFDSWREPFLDDYFVDGLACDNDRENDGASPCYLRCSPDWEAQTFKAQRHRPWQALRNVKRHEIPVSFVLAGANSLMVPHVVRRIRRVLPAASLKQQSGTSHFLPMEAPYLVRDQMSEYVSRFVEGFGPGEDGFVQRELQA